MTPHPGLADLADLADGRGRGPAVRAAADHAAACAGCGPLVADLRRMTSALAGAPAPSRRRRPTPPPYAYPPRPPPGPPAQPGAPYRPRAG